MHIKRLHAIGSRLAAVLAAVSMSLAAHAVTLDQVDTFQDGTIMNWSGGAQPTNIPTGGPAGAGDRYLSLTANQSGGPGSRIAAFNTDQWSGDYAGQGVRVLEADLANPNNFPLEIRAVLFGQFGSQWVTTVAVVLPANTGWRHVAFLIREADMTRTTGTESWAEVSSNAERLLLRHEVGSAGTGGTPQMGQLWLDNIAARSAVTVRPSVLTRLFGHTISGGLPELFESDDTYLRAEFDIASDVVSPIVYRIEGSAPFENPAQIQFTLEAAADSPNRHQVIQMFNFQSNQWDPLAQHSLSTSDLVTTVLITDNPGRYIQSGTGKIMATLSFDEGAAETTSLLTIRIDQAIWTITPP